MIEDLDVVSEPRPSWRARWLLPAAGGLLLGVVLTSSFLRFTPARQNVLDAAAPATGIKAIELPRNVANLETRLQFSGVTGLTSMEMSDGFRDTYRLGDGRLVIVTEYPDPANGALIAPPMRIDVSVRGTNGAVFETRQASQPNVIVWVADGMQYQVGGAFSTQELIGIAEQLR
jgi:hypothetical protein